MIDYVTINIAVVLLLKLNSCCEFIATFFSESLDVFTMCLNIAANRLRQQTCNIRGVIVAVYPVSENYFFTMIVLRQQDGHFFCDYFRFDVRQDVLGFERIFLVLIPSFSFSRKHFIKKLVPLVFIIFFILFYSLVYHPHNRFSVPRFFVISVYVPC